MSHFAKPHLIAAFTACDDQPLKVLRRAVFAIDAHRELPIQRLHRTGRRIDVFTPQRILNVINGELPRRQRFAVQPNAQRIAISAADADTRHARQTGEAVHEVALRVIGEFQLGVVIAGEIQIHQDLRPHLRLADIRRLDLLGKVGNDRPDRLTDVARRRVEITTEHELDGDLRFTIRADRGDVLDRLHHAHAIFQPLRDAPLHYRR